MRAQDVLVFLGRADQSHQSCQGVRPPRRQLQSCARLGLVDLKMYFLLILIVNLSICEVQSNISIASYCVW